MIGSPLVSTDCLRGLRSKLFTKQSHSKYAKLVLVVPLRVILDELRQSRLINQSWIGRQYAISTFCSRPVILCRFKQVSH